MKKILLLCIAAFFSSIASANDSYFEVDYMMLTQTLDLPGLDSFDANPPGISAKFGGNVSNNLAIEGVIGLGITDDTYVSVPGASFSGKLKTLFGANLVGILPIAGTSALFGKVGLAMIDSEISASASGVGSASKSYSDTGISYGFGFKVGINNNSGVVLEYVNYPDIGVNDFVTGSDKIKTTSINIGYRSSF